MAPPKKTIPPAARRHVARAVRAEAVFARNDAEWQQAVADRRAALAAAHEAGASWAALARELGIPAARVEGIVRGRKRD